MCARTHTHTHTHTHVSIQSISPPSPLQQTILYYHRHHDHYQHHSKRQSKNHPSDKLVLPYKPATQTSGSVNEIASEVGAESVGRVAVGGEGGGGGGGVLLVHADDVKGGETDHCAGAGVLELRALSVVGVVGTPDHRGVFLFVGRERTQGHS